MEYRKSYAGKFGERAKLVILEGSMHNNIYYHRDYRKIVYREVDELMEIIP